MTPAKWYVDPGKHKLALAAFVGGALAWLGSIEAFKTFPPAPGIERLVIEKPRVYPGGSKDSKGFARDPNDLIELTASAGWFAGVVQGAGGPAPTWEYPGDWKGQISKPQHHLRVWRALAPPERAVVAQACGMSEAEVEAKIKEACRVLAMTGVVKRYSWNGHNLLDAVGLGLFDLRRLGRAGATRGTT